MIPHPGLREDQNDFVTPLPQEKMQEFVRFMSTSELSEAETKYLVQLLIDLFNCCSNTWVPYACKQFRAASQAAFREKTISEPPTELNYDVVWVQTGDGGHHWLELLEKPPDGESQSERFNARRIVVDPTGLDAVNSQGNYKRENYQPYFGLPQHAPDKLQQAYFSKFSHVYLDRDNNELHIETVPFNPS